MSTRRPRGAAAAWPFALAAALGATFVAGAGTDADADPQAVHTALTALQPLIDATPTGATLRLESRGYRGPVVIARSITIDGAGAAHIVGDGHGTVVRVRADHVTLRGLRISGSGDSQDQLDAGVHLQGTGHRVEDSQIDDVLFGIDLHGADAAIVRRNRVRGKALPVALRGDPVRLWNSRFNRIEDNDFARGRDLTLINAPDNQVLRNQFRDGRYGLHAVFSPRLLAEGNRIEHTGTGIVVLYSPGLALRHNRVAHALTDGGAGIVLKESDDAIVEENEVLHCAVGFKVDAPIEGHGRLEVRGNQFAYNVVGLFFYGEGGNARFNDNRFDNNLTTVALSAPGAGSANRWLGNTWDDYEGFDRDGDRFGDTAHEAFIYADRIWMETPMTMFFRNSPVLELLDFLERLAPFSSPSRVLIDPRPRMPEVS